MKKSYKNGECPDCGDPIPKRTSDGDECKNCGHVFYKLKDTTKKNLYVVATIGNILNMDVFMDIIGVFSTLKKAEEIRDKVKAKEPIEGLNYALLQDHEDVVVACTCCLDKVLSND